MRQCPHLRYTPIGSELAPAQFRGEPRVLEPLRRADVEPQAVVELTAQRAARDGRIEDGLERPASGRETGEELGSSTASPP